jgi:hypothetical protein
MFLVVSPVEDDKEVVTASISVFRTHGLERTKIQGVAPVGGFSTSIKTSKESKVCTVF